MTLKTVPVGLQAMMPDGTPAAFASATAQLVDGRGVAPTFTTDGPTVVPWLVSGTAAADGHLVLQLWPNERGTLPTLYRVIVKLGEISVMNVLIAVPDTDPAAEVPLTQLINTPPWPAVTDSAQALQQLQAAQAALTALVETASMMPTRRHAWEDPFDYIGIAPLHALEADPVWRITRQTVAANGTISARAVAENVPWTGYATQAYN